MPKNSVPIAFDLLSGSAYIRQSELLKSNKNPSAPIPFSAATLWRKVKAGTFPKPVKLSERVTAWTSESVRIWLREVQS